MKGSVKNGDLLEKKGSRKIGKKPPSKTKRKIVKKNIGGTTENSGPDIKFPFSH